MTLLRRRLLAALGASLLAAPVVHAAEPAADDERWLDIRRALFADRPIPEDARGVIELDAPVRAADAAVVPVAIRTAFVQTPARYIRKVWLVIDKNPSPVGAIFHFTPDSGRAEIETRVRIEEYSQVRAVAEFNDGQLVMHTRYVKASGGCSAPAGKDLAEALASLGKMKLRVEGEVLAGQPALAQLMVSHPNVSGLAIDQLTRLAPKPHFVRRIEVRYADKPVLEAEVDFTISENPVVRFWFVPVGAGELRATVLDSENLKFETALAVQPKTGA
ncbi:MAG TPA: quinoprotein dehydrogenase-associated SoxYZ-like carrier [Methylibium sp.]|nr:quinoprotein dehydrogenase-associated SoxYZ-like carrier [Methylibium sp.]